MTLITREEYIFIIKEKNIISKINNAIDNQTISKRIKNIRK
jgi:hypothetical protein